MSAVGWGATVGLHPVSRWNNPEPEVVLAVDSRGRIRGATLGNDVNLRDVEGRSALLLGKAKDNNAACAIGPFIRLFDDGFTLDDVRAAELTLTVEGTDGFRLEGRSSMREISRDPADLVAQTIGRHHQYPDGLMLFLGTMFAPVQDRDAPGQGFTHHAGDVVTIAAPGLGALVNTVGLATEAPEWTFGAAALMRNLAGAGAAGVTGRIRVGVGGWIFEPWRGSFYPEGLAQKRELEYASRQLTSIEINGTYYGSQKPESFREVARGDARRLRLRGQGAALRHQPAGAGRGRRVGRALLRLRACCELGDKLGPVNWQFMATQEVRPRRLRRLPRAAAGERRGPADPPRASRCGTRASAARSSWRSPARTASRWSSRATRDYPQIADADRALRLCPDHGHARGGRDGLRRRRPRPLGRRAPGAGPTGETPDGLETRSAAPPDGAGPRRLSLRDQRRQAAQPGCGDGADRAARLTAPRAPARRGRRCAKAGSRWGGWRSKWLKTMISIAVSGIATNMPVTPQSAPKANSDRIVTNRLMLSELPASRGSRMLPITNCTAPTPASTASAGPGAWNCISAKTAGSTVPRIEPMVGM